VYEVESRVSETFWRAEQELEETLLKLMTAGLLALNLSACVTPSQPGTTGGVLPSIQVEPNRQFDLSMGQEAKIQGSGITVRFVGVGEDSRCPMDVQCVWAGNAIVRLSLISTQESSKDAALNTTLDPKSTQYGGFTFQLVGLKPSPRSGTRIAEADYVATLQATK
jgi:hypothetical protein